MQPIIKWAGGKRQIIQNLLQYIPHDYKRYVEPFLGSGAFFLELSPARAILNDSNAELINLYIQIRDNLESLKKYALKYQNKYNALETEAEKSKYYYEKRCDFNKHILSKNLTAKDAALLMFLNKTCYNGLYRVNSKGLYNTPFGKRTNINIFDEDNLDACSLELHNAKILNKDFEVSCRYLRKGDFVYFDSPYYDTFDTYQAEGFSINDHIRLAELFKRLSQRGIYCLLSNSDTDFIKNLYKDFYQEVIHVKRIINRNGQERTATEILISNYKVNNND